MKITTLIIIFVLIRCCLYSQTYDRHYNPNYMWTTLDEHFDSDLQPSVWTPATHFKRGLGFLVNSPNNINLSNSNLELKMKYVPNYLDSIWKTSGWVREYSNYTCAEIHSVKPFQYGIFECRAKYAMQSGSWPAFWLIGGDGVPCPVGGYGNEIDIAELSCQSLPDMMHVIHRYYPSTDCNVSNRVQKDKKNYSLSMSMANVYSTYKCIWTPDKIQYFVNDNLIHEVVNQNYEWFPSLPLDLILSQQVTQPYDILGQAISPITPQTSYFDYVRVKQFFLAPEITCPQIICSNGTATMNVDPAVLAGDVSWVLTPSNLFNGTTSGTGKTVNIAAASSSFGKGKITYSFIVSTDLANPKEIYTAEKEIWIKGPDPSEVSFDVFRSDGTHATKVGNTWIMCPNTTYQIFVMNSSPVPLSNYTWTIPSAWTRNYTSQNMISIYTNSSPGGQVSVSATNTASGCNNTVQIITGYMGSSYSCGSYYMSFTPNPTTSETTMVLSADGEKTINENTQWELEVYDQQQTIKEKKTRIKGKQTKINTSDWKDGVYIVRALIDGELISDKLAVKH